MTIPGWQIASGLPTVVRYGTPGFPETAKSWPASRGNLFAGGGGGTAKLATAAIGSAGKQARPVLDYRQAAGTVAAGATRARVTITLTTTLTNWNGPGAPQAGYNYATAADISLTLNQPAPAPAPLMPPVAGVPRYQHVFLFYFENEDYSQVIGNTKQAPYLNSLRRRGTTLTNFYAEEHPSDANYLALAGGSAFGIPLTDPEEENPLYNIDAANIGDLLTGGGESWKAPDDCAGMEGCGIAAGDDFLKTELTAIMNSPAWRTQRSLAIITFDEDAQDYQHPAQRVPTIVPASAGVKVATAAAVLAWTTRLRVGIGVLPVPLRNVAVTAMETATLHRLFPGRVTVGVGHGVQDWMGQVGARPESPVTLLREYIEALRALLRGERVTTHGRYVHLDGVQLGWPPAGAPAVLAGARGPRTLRPSGEVADGSILDRVTTREDFRSAREAIDAGRAAVGRPDSHRIVQYMGADPGDPGAIAETVRSWAAAGVGTVVLHPTSADQDPMAHIRFAAQVRPLLT